MRSANATQDIEARSPARSLARRFCAELAGLRAERVFNPYRDLCPEHDAPEAASIRRANLDAYLTAALAARPRTAWIGRDLGYRGGRRTGLPLTDDIHLRDCAAVFGATLRKSTRTPAVAERTAREIWRVVGALQHPPFLWNAFPLHPFGDSPQTNRRHSRAEFDRVADLLSTLLGAFRFDEVYALGADSAQALTRIGVAHTRLRHPSFGGHPEFRRQIQAEYRRWISP